MDRCTEATPALVEIQPGRQVRCFLHSDAVDQPVTLRAGKAGR